MYKITFVYIKNRLPFLLNKFFVAPSGAELKIKRNDVFCYFWQAVEGILLGNHACFMCDNKPQIS